MKKKLTNNLGLKIISLLAAFILWMIVVNTDDPMITRTYSGISVEVINTEEIINQKKTFEILDNTDTISVIVHAKRSIIEDMSRDYIRATADMKAMTSADTIPIEVRSTRFADRIDSLTPVTRSVRVQIEDLGIKKVRITAETQGEPVEGYVAGAATPSVNILSVSGPASTVDRVASARAIVDVSGVKSDISTNAPVTLLDENGNIVAESMLDMSVLEVHVDVKILSTKTIPVSYGHIAGVPADGYQMTGGVSLSPDSVRVAGSGSGFEGLESLKIPDDVVSVAGASGNVETVVDASKYLPDGAIFADPDFDGKITVTVYVGGITGKEISIPAINISISNVPEGYSAMLVDAGGVKNVTVYGLTDKIKQADGNTITGVINASAAIPPELVAQGLPLQGTYSGEVALNLPNGVSATETVHMDFMLNLIAASFPVIEAPDGAATEEGAALPNINNEIAPETPIDSPEIVPEVTFTEGGDAQ